MLAHLPATSAIFMAQDWVACTSSCQYLAALRGCAVSGDIASFPGRLLCYKGHEGVKNQPAYQRHWGSGWLAPAAADEPPPHHECVVINLLPVFPNDSFRVAPEVMKEKPACLPRRGT